MSRLIAVIMALWLGAPALADGLVALARVDPARTAATDVGPDCG